MMKGKAYLTDIEVVVRNIREYKQQKSPIYADLDEYNMLHINSFPI